MHALSLGRFRRGDPDSVAFPAHEMIKPPRELAQ